MHLVVTWHCDFCFESAAGNRFHKFPCYNYIQYPSQIFAVETSHIIPVGRDGTSKDIRNGVLLCKNHHTLFGSHL
ncbi:MAG: HNH endonuclease [Nitrososphaerota archaeon]|nr:HNH endonuclease [Nitrososphaerota archaeon]